MSMDWIYKMGDKVAEVGNAASDKAKTIAEVAKLNGKIRTAEQDVHKVYTLIGKEMYDTRLDAEAKHDFTDDYQEIEEKLKEMEVYRDAVCAMKGNSKCPVCGAEVEKDSGFCKKCGAKMEQL